MAEITPVLTRHITAGEPPLDLEGYRRVGGYESMRRAIESKELRLAELPVEVL